MSNLYYLNERGQYIGRDKSTFYDKLTKNRSRIALKKRNSRPKET